MRANTKANTKAENEIAVKAATDVCKTYTNAEIKEILFGLVTKFDATTGQYMIGDTANPVEDSVLNRLSFVKNVDNLIDSVRDGYEYGILNALSKITSKAYTTDLGICELYIERTTKNNFIKEIPLNDLIFEDEIVSIYWKSLTPLMKRTACLILVAIGHLTDRWFNIPCSNYNGDSCNFYGCLDANKFSFFQGRIPGTEMNED